ncbi:hypothetical protein ASPZODRAFT_769959 [Penicilliopsis zonata CBS 506.65]|uniref:PARP-type domain-containing protein n=1 Tax=Penicilliopsis zonata CBS 506.65 TaxID=1073090 RepID=A0A1L9SAY5_9EURO|nr:hypothetical protein ASPZODRAFT_769959 [Penicilliopsis zonata CBS 506.65]OJJ44311.1 hypothetical protein ASPZODRAFT_769959 [Penicilliopsis zonata CBS 506.65]
MGSYRLEEASTGRAGCQNKECKEAKIKIAKGELRLGSWVDTGNFQSWYWRHWGCVTPKVITNLSETLDEVSGADGKDFSELDGYEDLSSENQEKVRKALEQGHVDDEDWKGDPDVNRPGKTGFRKRATPKKKKEEEEEEETEGEEKEKEEEKPTKATKRGRADHEEAEPATKKARAPRSKKAAAQEVVENKEADAVPKQEPEPKTKPSSKRARAAVVTADDEVEKPKRGRKPKAKPQEDIEEEVVQEKKKPRRGRRKSAE